MNTKDSDALRFARNLMTLLDQGSFTSTYKYALLIALIELCQEEAPVEDGAQSVLSTTAITERMFHLYWPQATAAPDLTDEKQLTQIAGPNEIAFFREFATLAEARSGLPLDRARRLNPDGYERAVRRLERTVATEPIPKLQRLSSGAGQLVFLYDFPDGGHRDRIRFRSAATENLVGTADLLRPVIEHRWALKVALLNRLNYRRLDQHLFGSERVSLEPVREDLLGLNNGQCFYCGASVTTGEVDHFIPWIRHHDNRIENLVPACRRCNNAKRDTPASTRHLARWLARLEPPASVALSEVAERRNWGSDPRTVRAIAKSLYSNLSDGSELWDEPGKLVPLDQTGLTDLLH